ncbi:helix-turn-helix domain-containing protein [Brachybacterium massiliense]|uniref:helix-turn-helix domain-containing protein n=1 Tax=Brachybacterium massiliense TaxID=1755098 RepID=UPI000B3BC0EC|nr:helix-turn-helix domain-containing protein [Brachybacterium massiliense]
MIALDEASPGSIWKWAPSDAGGHLALLLPIRGIAVADDGGSTQPGDARVLAHTGESFEWVEPALVVSVWAHGSFLEEMGADLESLPATLSSESLLVSVRSFLFALVQSSQGASALSLYLTERLILDMVFASLIASTGHSAVSSSRFSGLARARLHMSARSADPEFSVDLAANELSMSVRHLQRLFAPTGQTPSTHLRRLRLANAQELLQSTDAQLLSMDAIARLSGFSSARTLRRALKSDPGTETSGHSDLNAPSFDL